MSDFCKGEVWLDGEKMDGVRSVSFRAGVDEMNEVTLSFYAKSVEIKGPADVIRRTTALEVLAESPVHGS
jgi:hypothetical protein